MHNNSEYGRPADTTELREKSETERHEFAEALARRLDPAMGVLGIVFALVVLAETLTEVRGALRLALSVTAWGLWGVFATEFVVRMVIAPSVSGFLKRNWWQALFLVLPFLRLLRLLRVARLARAGRVGRVLSSTVRASRGAGQVLSGRIGWLASVTVIFVLSASQLLYEFGDYRSYSDALYEASINAVTGEPLREHEGIARLVTLGLAVYAGVFFASLAGMLGAFFLRSEEKHNTGADATESVSDPDREGRPKEN